MNKKIISALTVLISGGGLTFAFAPFNLWPLAILAPAILLYFWWNNTANTCFWYGWLFGVGLFSTGVYWIYISLYNYGQASPWFAILLTSLLILFLGLYVGINGYCFTKIFPHNHFAKLAFGFPTLWVIFEWLRTWILTGFPWLLIGYSQITSSLRGLAPVFSVYGVSWAVCLTSGVLTSFIVIKNRRWHVVGILLLIALWGSSHFLASIRWTKPIGKPIKVSLVQGNIPQTLKWQPEQAQKILQRYQSLTSQHWDSDIIIWPEAAITINQKQADNFLKQLSKQAKKHGTAIITGIPIIQGPYSYNGMLAIGNGKGTYLKRHLVPFGEYLPLRTLFGIFSAFVAIPMSDFSAGEIGQSNLSAGQILLAPYICYEIAYPQEVRKTLFHAQGIVVVTDDSWFGRSIASSQHLQIAQMRALETGREVLFSSNNGITAIIGRQGQIKRQLPKNKQLVLTGYLQPTMSQTPWLFWGIWPMVLLMSVFLIFSRQSFFQAKSRL